MRISVTLSVIEGFQKKSKVEDIIKEVIIDESIIKSLNINSCGDSNFEITIELESCISKDKLKSKFRDHPDVEKVGIKL